MSDFAAAGSQRWVQVAIERRPEVLRAALVRSQAIAQGVAVDWSSPLRADRFREYRDQRALAAARIGPLAYPLSGFWPARGPVWDAIGVTSDCAPVFVEAKAHIPEAASPPSRASESSLTLIQQSLGEARRWYAPETTADWSGLFYQYANRLAYHYFLCRRNGVPSLLVFLYFINEPVMKGPASEAEWKGAIRLIHAALGVPADLTRFGVYEAFVDVTELTNAV